MWLLRSPKTKKTRRYVWKAVRNVLFRGKMDHKRVTKRLEWMVDSFLLSNLKSVHLYFPWKSDAKKRLLKNVLQYTTIVRAERLDWEIKSVFSKTGDEKKPPRPIHRDRMLAGTPPPYDGFAKWLGKAEMWRKLAETLNLIEGQQRAIPRGV